MLYNLSGEELDPGKTLSISGLPSLNKPGGITIDFQVEIQDLAPGLLIMGNMEADEKGFKIETGEYGSVVLFVSDGLHSGSWSSDPGHIKAYGETAVGIIIDNEPAIIQFVINGIVCDGGSYRQFGWGRFDRQTGDVFNGELIFHAPGAGSLSPEGRINHLRIYKRALMNTELIGNHRYMKNH